MAARGKCHKCGKVVSGPDSYHNKVVKCSGCGERVRLLAASGRKREEEISGSNLAYGGVLALTAFMLLMQIIFILFLADDIRAEIVSLAGIIKIVSVVLLAGTIGALYIDDKQAIRVLAIIQSVIFSLVSIYFLYYISEILGMFRQVRGIFVTTVAIIDALTIVLFPACAIFSGVKAFNTPNETPEWLKRIRRRRHDKLSVKGGQGTSRQAEKKNNGCKG
jgi:hypothetical protein